MPTLVNKEIIILFHSFTEKYVKLQQARKVIKTSSSKFKIKKIVELINDN